MSVPAISAALPPASAPRLPIGMRSLSELVYPDRFNIVAWRYRNEDTTDLSIQYQSVIVKVLSLELEARNKISERFLFTEPDEIASVLKAASDLDQVDLEAILALSFILKEDREKVVAALKSIPREERTAIFERSTSSVQDFRADIILTLTKTRLEQRLKIIQILKHFNSNYAGQVIKKLATLEINKLDRLYRFFTKPVGVWYDYQGLEHLLGSHST